MGCIETGHEDGVDAYWFHYLRIYDMTVGLLEAKLLVVMNEDRKLIGKYGQFLLLGDVLV